MGKIISIIRGFFSMLSNLSCVWDMFFSRSIDRCIANQRSNDLAAGDRVEIVCSTISHAAYLYIYSIYMYKNHTVPGSYRNTPRGRLHTTLNPWEVRLAWTYNNLHTVFMQGHDIETDKDFFSFKFYRSYSFVITRHEYSQL